jgi:hypothetical protein
MFLTCESLSSTSFEPNSQLKRIKAEAYSTCHFSTVIPSIILFVAYDTHPDVFRLSLSDLDSCSMFDRWRRLRRLGIAVDFQRIRRFASALPHFKDFVLDLSGFEEKSGIGQNDRVSSQIYMRRIDGAMTVVKAISLSGSIQRRQIKGKIKNLLNLRHPMIAPLIGCVFPVKSSRRQEFKTVRSYAPQGLSPIFFLGRLRGVGIVLGLRFVYGLGLLHGAVKASNILFDADRRIQITDFSLIRLETGAVKPFSGECGHRRWTFARLRLFFLRSRSMALPLRPSVERAARLSLPLFQHLFRE